MKLPRKNNLELYDDNVLAIFFALQDKLASYEKSLADELKKDSPDREEIAFFGYEFNRTYNAIVKVEQLMIDNKIDY